MGELIEVLKSQKNHHVMGDRKRSTEVSRFNSLPLYHKARAAEHARFAKRGRLQVGQNS